MYLDDFQANSNLYFLPISLYGSFSGVRAWIWGVLAFIGPHQEVRDPFFGHFGGKRPVLNLDLAHSIWPVPDFWPFPGEDTCIRAPGSDSPCKPTRGQHLKNNPTQGII